MPIIQAPRRRIGGRLGGAVASSAVARVFGYPDFRLLWIGAFLSFTGSWVQNVAQGYYVFSLTGSESKLAFVSFCSSIPVLIFAFLAGTLTDQLDKRKVLIASQVLLGLAAIYMSVAIYFKFIQYWQIVIVSLFIGIVGCVEMPTRQSIVSRVVPPEDLSAAVPVNAMTFNVARIFGPALGGLILAALGVPLCYLLNGLSFLALVWSAVAIKADLRPRKGPPQPIKDLIFEGLLYTMRDKRLTALLLLETCTAAFGIAYLPLMPAYVEQALGFQGEVAKHVLGYAYTVVGIGSLIGLLLVTHYSHTDRKGTIIRLCMWTIGIGLIVLSFTHQLWLAFLVFAAMGAATVSQFNTTNALFQLLSPDRLRGRVLAMHVWALSGLSPFGVLFFGWLAQTTRLTGHFAIGTTSIKLGSTGVPLVMQVGGVLMILGAISAMLSKRGLTGLHERAIDLEPADA
jgi:MFS family permease